ncbi:translation initiation factor IF-3 [candidate division KSB1 bacterium]
MNKTKRVRINEDIRNTQIRLIGSDSKQIGIVESSDALRKAMEEDLDLVEISPNANPPVCKIMDFGKYKYELSKKEKDSKKRQHVIHVKEIRFRPKTEKHDLEFKIKNGRKFLEQGNKLKITIMFRGREIIYEKFGRKILDEVEEALSDIAKLEAPVRKEGRNLIAYFIKK